MVIRTRSEANSAKAFLRQQELPPFQELLRHTAAWLQPRRGQRWLDVGCGSGQLSRILWQKSQGQIETVIGVDHAEAGQAAYADMRSTLEPRPTPMCVRFAPADLSRGFSAWQSEQFDGVVSGLSLQYAESYSWQDGRWTAEAYDRVLAEVQRLLKPAGDFVFSAHVPNPSWSKIALRALVAGHVKHQPLRTVKNSWRMWTYGTWLTRESHSGRYHYLPLEAIVAKLKALDFVDIEHRLSYAGQAYVIRCRKTVHKPQARCT